MRVFRGVSAARVPPVVRAVLGCVPGAAAVGLLLLCALFVGPGVSGASGQASDGPVAFAGLGERAGVTGRHSVMPAAAAPVRRAVEHPAAQPHVVPRAEWLAGAVREPPPARYADRVQAVFVHHTDTPNSYDCADAPRTIRYLYAGQTGGRQWDDIGYNFLVDRCGTVYEGRAGGIERAVVGAHTQGFNQGSVGIAAIGTFTAGSPVPRAMTDAVAALVAWKLGLSDVDPRSTVRLVSSNSLSKYPAGARVLFSSVSGHNDGYSTSCPGAALTAALPAIRETAARLQNR
ncbi:peptidoglycan recognition protein family protein [Streptomyces sp. BA2]|uniref:peptidoglycan recognition protein family protein n=1 Tax=Streptomyces sp. BA2 TaxID=436595 RepID=UPI001328E257|nr:peptidoglycan recognition protein [Streptomyces sp. BA2]MWA10666.1 N-acetylmuramoyl-L-alanine amidase [Streptomyces sp. BA2]